MADSREESPPRFKKKREPTRGVSTLDRFPICPAPLRTASSTLIASIGIK